MNHELDMDLIKEDLKAVRDSFVKFGKSFGPSPSQYSLKDESRIKFGLWWNTVLGPVRQFKLVVSIIVFVLWFFVLFLHSTFGFKLLDIVLFILFYGWLWSTELEADAKDGKLYKNNWFDKMAHGLHTAVQAIFAKKEEKKK